MAPLVALTGFMGSGKTTVGGRVAQLLGWRFVDLDEEIVKADGISIPEYFATRGEDAFREREREVLAALLDTQASDAGLVLALGGGTLEIPGVPAFVKSRGAVVYLEVEPGLAWARVEASGRPLARTRPDFDSLMAKRRSTYEEVADWATPVGRRTTEDLAGEVAEIARRRGSWDPSVWGRRIVSTTRPSIILGGRHALATLQDPPLASRSQGSYFFVVTDQNVMRYWGDRALGILDADLTEEGVLVLEPGEASKSADNLERCWDWLADRKARRDDTVVAFGGGVVGDLAGFAAATYQRGIGLWQVPTTLLAQVDSSVGGKTGIDLRQGKNLVGAFYHPDLVIADPSTLSTLPDFEYQSGLAEVVKYGLLDPGAFFTQLEGEARAVTTRDEETVGRLVKKCMAYKSRVVGEDERDQGRRAVLNLGHTTAHALEVTRGYGVLSHGQAVALGLLVALAVSERLFGLDGSVRARTRRLLETFGLPLVTQLPHKHALLEAASRDKKVVTGTSGFVGLRAVGEPVWGLDVSRELFDEALEVIRA